MIWSMLKNYIKKKNLNFFLTEVEKHANDFFDTFDNAKWAKCVKHVKKIEDEYLQNADDLPLAM